MEEISLDNLNPQGELMKQQEDVECMLTLHTLGWGHKRIAKELGIRKNTVKKYLKQKGGVI
ncbi:hypothetical protein [Neochlamydia sp. EPS4]|uniref:hypothetical protein n=1 Tax=Neochlamydia sp. EPS4 TaxID=1478175 RepID=UPI0012BAE991|nr:hypothetical protein [Neochlamydia sp. EPS4]